MILQNYFAFVNAKEASQYYEKQYKAEVKNRIPLTKEVAEQLNLKIDDLENSTFSSTINIFGIDFQISDRLDKTGDFSDSVNMLINFTANEKDYFNELVELVKEDQDANILYDNIDSEQSYKMFRFKDKYNLIWSFISF